MCDCPRPITTYEEVRVGSRLKADNLFTCLDDGDIVEVLAGSGNDLYVMCRDGRHYLDGQINEAETGYEGFTRV